LAGFTKWIKFYAVSLIINEEKRWQMGMTMSEKRASTREVSKECRRLSKIEKGYNFSAGQASWLVSRRKIIPIHI